MPNRPVHHVDPIHDSLNDFVLFKKIGKIMEKINLIKNDWFRGIAIMGLGLR